ncbi:MAG: hypothetical protein WBO61_09785, partial [Gemmiger qucibialis]
MRVFGLSKRTSIPTFTSITPLSRVYLKSRKYRLFLQTQVDVHGIPHKKQTGRPKACSRKGDE